MKRKVKTIFFFVIAAIVLTMPARAAEYTYHSDDIGEDAAIRKWEELEKTLPDSVKKEFGGFGLTEPADSLTEKTSLGYWTKIAYEKFTSAASEILPDLTVLLTIIILMAIANAALPDMSPPVADAFGTLSMTATAVPLITSTYSAIKIAEVFLTEITSLMEMICPIMEVMYLTEGSLTQAAVATTGITVAVTAISNVNTTLMTPIATVLFTLSALSAVCGDVKLGGFTSSVRKLLMRMWQILTLFFSFMIGTQSIIARSADTLATRTARFAISSMIPVAGGIIAEAYNTLKEGVAYIRTAAGIGGIILVLLILLAGIIPLLVYKAAFGITSYAAGMLKIEGTSKLLDEIKGIMDLIIAIVLYTSLMFVFALVLFAKSREV